MSRTALIRASAVSCTVISTVASAPSPLRYETPMAEAAKLGLLSCDATIRSNLSVAPPFDMVVYRKDTIGPLSLRRIAEDDPYFVKLRETYSGSMRDLVRSLDLADWDECR